MKIYLTLLSCMAILFLLAQKPTVPFSCFETKKKLSKSTLKSIDTRSDSIDIVHTDLHIDLSDWNARMILAEANIEIIALQDNISSIRLDLQGLQVDSVKSFGNILNHEHNGSSLFIELGTTLNQNQPSEIQIFYGGTPIQNPGDWGGFYWNSTYAFNIGVSFLEDPHNYGRIWFPCFDNFVERETFGFHITTDDTRKAFCNGILIEEINNMDGTKTWHWEMGQEIPSYLASLAVSNYETINMTYNGIQSVPIPIQLAARASDTAAMKASFVHLENAMQCYEENYAPYAFSRVGYCLSSFNSGAMEHATNITYMRAAVNGTTNYETLMAHELSHHWWGNLVTCETEGDMWLNEGWASFSEALFIEFVYGEDAYKNYSRVNHDNVLRLIHHNDGGYYPVSGVPSDKVYSSTVYDKGADMAHTLRGILGEIDFQSCIEGFLNDYSFQEVNSSLFESYLSACSGKDLSSFFESWISEKGFHHYSIKDFTTSAIGNSFLIEGSIQQKLWENTNYTTYLPIDVTFYNSPQEFQTVQVNTYGPCSSFSFELPFDPKYYALDVEEKIQDATVDKYEYINQIGTNDFDLARVIFNVRTINDSVLMHATHHYIKPEPFQEIIEGLHLSPNRYWSIGGVWDENFKTDAIFRYNGSNNSLSGLLDNDFITNSEDSLVILFKAKPQDNWEIVDSFELNTQGSTQNKTGYFEVFNARQGDYVLGIFNNQFANDTQQFSPCKFTGLIERDGLLELADISPIPTQGLLKITIKNKHNKVFQVKINNMLGKEVFTHRLNPNESVLNVYTAEWLNGAYIVSIYDESSLVFNQKVVVN